MDIGQIGVLIMLVLGLGALGFVIFSMVRSMRNEHEAGHSIWRQFGLAIALMVLFFVTWIGHGIAEWQTFTDDAHAHHEVPKVGDFLSAFAQSTLENWQSEFLQLFAFVALAALFVFKGSAESRDSDDRIEASLRRIEEQVGSLPASAADLPPNQLPDPEPR